MPETRYIDTYDDQGNLISHEPYVVSDHKLNQEAINDQHVELLAAYNNWDSLTPPEQVAVIKKLLFRSLVKDGWV